MELTQEDLQRIIKEELDKVMNEEELEEGLFDFLKGKKLDVFVRDHLNPLGLNPAVNSIALAIDTLCF